MLSRIFNYIVFAFSYPFLFVIGLLVCSVTLVDDIEIYSGKSTTKKWSKETRFVRKYLYWDYRQHIIWWHYVLLWVYIVSYILALPALILYDIFYDTKFFPVFRTISLIVDFTASLSLGILCFCRHSLYRGNITRRRPKKATKSQKERIKFAKSSKGTKKQRN